MARCRPSVLTGATLLGLLLGLAASFPGARADTRQRLQQNREALDHIRSRIEQATQTIDHDRGAQDAQRSAVEKAERRIQRTQRALKAASADVAAQEGKVRDAQAAANQAQTELDAERERLARQLRAAYVMGNTGAAQLLLGSEPLDRKDRLMTYYDDINRASAAQIAGIQTRLATVQARQAEVDRQLKVLRKVEAGRRRALVELEADRAAREQAIKQLDARLSDEHQRLAELKDNEAQVEGLLRALQKALADEPVRPSGRQKSFPAMRGKHPWPLRGDILANYGDPKADSRLQWKGIWIGAPEGTEVHATAHGRVAYVGWLSSYGLVIVIEHENGYFTLYGHAASVVKRAGEPVDSGEVIAFAGNTGGYERTGLYFEVRKGTEPLDPRDWLSR